VYVGDDSSISDDDILAELGEFFILADRPEARERRKMIGNSTNFK
jgi:hypothetical protein